MANQDIIAILKELDEFVGGLAQKLNVNVVAELQSTTPVDTGWARINWVPSFGQPFSGTAGTRSLAEQGSLDPNPQANGVAALASQYKLGFGDIFISNNVDYITKLNDGSSRKAPRYFVQAAIAKSIVDLGGVRV